MFSKNFFSNMLGKKDAGWKQKETFCVQLSLFSTLHSPPPPPLVSRGREEPGDLGMFHQQGEMPSGSQREAVPVC